MQQARPGYSNLRLLLLMVFLAAAAAAVAYFLYIKPLQSHEAATEVPARAPPSQTTIQIRTKTKGRLTPREKREIQTAAVLDEFASPADPRPAQPLIVPKPIPIEVKLPAAPTEGESEKPARESPARPAEPDPIKEVDLSASPAKKDSPPLAPGPATGPAEQVKPLPTDTAERDTQPKTEKKTSPVPRLWAINALSTQDRDKLRRTMDALVQIPHTVYAYKANIKGQEWYRIRIGFFKTRQEAERVGSELAREHKLPTPWILRPKSEEIKAHHPEFTE